MAHWSVAKYIPSITPPLQYSNTPRIHGILTIIWESAFFWVIGPYFDLVWSCPRSSCDVARWNIQKGNGCGEMPEWAWTKYRSCGIWMYPFWKNAPIAGGESLKNIEKCGGCIWYPFHGIITACAVTDHCSSYSDNRTEGIGIMRDPSVNQKKRGGSYGNRPG